MVKTIDRHRSIDTFSLLERESFGKIPGGCQPASGLREIQVFLCYHLCTTQDKGIPLNAFPKETTSTLAGFLFTLSFTLSAKQDAVNTNFLKSLVWTNPESNSGSTALQADAPSYSANVRYNYNNFSSNKNINQKLNRQHI